MDITFSNNARKSIRKLDQKIKKIIQEAIIRLPDGDVKKLIGIENGYRLRVGDYRILYEKTKEEIHVIDVLPRGGAYRRL